MSRLNKSALLLLLFIISPFATASESATLDSNTFAIINGERISAINYQTAINNGMRQRFYHGNIPDQELLAFKKEVAETIIDNVLLLQQARKQHLEADEQSINQQLEAYEQRYRDREQWLARREKLLPQIRRQLENQSLLRQITAELKQAPQPNEDAVLSYYRANPDKFTTPQKRKVSLILLKVDPSSPRSVWDSARSEAAELIENIRGGESFSELAKIHSGDEQSAGVGGDMGYLHQGMLAKEAEAALDTLAVNEISDPITTLQGVVILRLDAITAAALNDFAVVKQRAAGLLSRDLAEQHYQKMLAALRSSATITVNTALVERSN